MITKECLNQLNNNLEIIKTAGSKYYRRVSSAKSVLQKNVDNFIREYKDFFPTECRILEKYMNKFFYKDKFTTLEIKLIQEILECMDEDFNDKICQPKIFISHSGKDIDIIKNFVDLLSHIGLTSESLFCSSIPGYNIKQGSGDIYDNLRNEFNNNLYVIFMLSENYYESKACLNEMGAAWVLKKKYQSILLPGFDFNQIEGAINPRAISFKLDDEENRRVYLGELKDNIIEFLGMERANQSKWDYYSQKFWNEVDKT